MLDYAIILTDNGWLQINKNCSGDVFSGTSFREEGVEGIITTTNGLVTWHLSIRLDAVLQTIQLPTSISYLNSSLSHMDGDTLALKKWIK